VGTETEALGRDPQLQVWVNLDKGEALLQLTTSYKLSNKVLDKRPSSVIRDRATLLRIMRKKRTRWSSHTLPADFKLKVIPLAASPFGSVHKPREPKGRQRLPQRSPPPGHRHGFPPYRAVCLPAEAPVDARAGGAGEVPATCSS
jgi:hypothetical protein